MLQNKELKILSKKYLLNPTKATEDRIIQIVEKEMNNAGHERMLWHAERVENTVKSTKILCFLLVLLLSDFFGISIGFAILISLSITLFIKDYLTVFTISLYEKRVVEKDQFAAYWTIKANDK